MIPPTATATPTNPPWAPILTPELPASVAEATALEAADTRSETDRETEAALLDAEAMAEEAAAEAEVRVAEAAEAAEETDPEALVASAEASLSCQLLLWDTDSWTYLARAEVSDTAAEEASETASEAPAERDDTADLVYQRLFMSENEERKTYPAAASIDSAAEAAELVASAMRGEAEEAAPPSSVEVVSAASAAAEVEVAAGASPMNVFGV
jgi:hypothetical protein